MGKPTQRRGKTTLSGKTETWQDAKIITLFQQGLGLHQRGQLTQAEAIYKQILAKQPEHFDALHLMGVISKQTGQYLRAAQLIGQAIRLKPDYAEAWNNLGNVLMELKRFDEALASYGNAIGIKQNYADAFNNRGNALMKLKRQEEALASYDQAIALKPDYADAFNNRGNALVELKRPDEALKSFHEALAIKPNDVDVLNNLGCALMYLRRTVDSLAIFDKAIAIKSHYADGFNNRGLALMDLRRLDEALESFNKAITLKPAHAEALNNRGLVLADLQRPDEALTSYSNALAIHPGHNFLYGRKLHAQMQVCNWTELNGQIDRLRTLIMEGCPVTSPFPVLGFIDDLSVQRKASEIYTQYKYPEILLSAAFKKAGASPKIRIGYYSADFHNHATSYLMAELFESHNTGEFEVYAFSFGPAKQDAMRQRIFEGCDEFFDVRHLSDTEVVNLSREKGIDIAIDLKGFTKDSRTGIFAQRCAPIQVNYLGYPGTMCAPYMDYLIADNTLIPKESRIHYAEKVVYLPHSYQVNDSKRKISGKVFTRRDAGLPEQAFVFCCFNNNYKIFPASFDGWMRLLRSVDNSVLWLLEDNAQAAENLRTEAQTRGVDPSRLVFAKRMDLPDHLARHRLADLFIDTLPYNAHTTASDALWAGLPVLTLTGQSFAARVAASLLNAIDLSDMIAGSQADYEAKAIELATCPELLRQIKGRLDRNRLSSPLFNGQRFTKHLEAAYSVMYDRYRAGQPLADIHIQPINE